MINLINRPELARLNDLLTVVLHHTNDDTGLNVILSDYPPVWAALIDGVEPEDETYLALQAKEAYDAILWKYAARIPIQHDEDGYVEEGQAWALAEQIYDAVYDFDDRRHRAQMLFEIVDWIREGDWHEDQVPDVDALAAEWREYAGEV